MFKKICLSTLLLTYVFFAQGYSTEAEKVIFSGVPVLKISEGGISRVVEDIKEDRALEFKCTITKIGDKYFWTSRDNVELVTIQSGAFLTFVSTTGSGYVRVILPEMKDAAACMDETEKKYDYVEHMMIGLKSVTYYGKSR